MKRVTAAVVIKDNKILLAQRPMGDSLEGKWEFPGGKIEMGETPESCLLRELNEELGLSVAIERFYCNSIYTYPKGQIELLAYLCKPLGVVTQLNAHSQVLWLDPNDVVSMDLAPADIPIALQLKSDFGK